MSLQVEKLENNMAKLTIEVSAEEFEAAVKVVYNKNKGKFNIPGFRKGKAPQAMVEKMYGAGIFFEDAANHMIDTTYSKAVDECEEEIVSRPTIEVVQIEKGKPFIYTATVALKPEVTLGDYKGIEVERAAAEVTDTDVEEELKKAQEKNARMITIEDKPVADGNHLIIDFQGFVDGEAFEGGTGNDYPLIIGSHTFIDTFEEQLIGKNLNEECEVNVTFPEDYNVKELAGKPALFKVTVKDIKEKELPELSDEFASEVSDFDTLAEYKEDIKAKLLEKKNKDAATENENRVVNKAVENASMEIPEAMIDTQAQNMVEDYGRRLKSQGLSLDQYMHFTGMTIEKLLDQMKPQAEKRIKTRLVLEAIVAAENIQISQEALEQEIAKMAEAYQMEADKLKDYIGEHEKEQMKLDLAVQEAVDFLVAEAKLV